MKKTNKGFTLVELLMAVAVFSIVMVGIISIMSSSMKAYSKSNLDVDVQEDAQLVANQLEEILTDATSISGNLTTGYIVRTDSGNYTISYSDNCIKLTDSSDTYTLAKNVSEFNIDGWSVPGDGSAGAAGSSQFAGDADNKVSVHIALDNNSSSYSLDRTVYFRNNVESNTFKNIKYHSSSSGSGPVDGSVKTLEVKRYQKYDLSALYGIVDGCTLKKVSGDSFVDDTSAATFFDLTNDGSELPGLGGKKAWILKTGGSVNTNFGNPLSGNTYGVIGKTKDGSEVKIKFHVSPVQIKNDVVLQAHDGANGTVNNEGFINPIVVEGININEAIKASGSITTQYALYDGGTAVTTYSSVTRTSAVGGTFNFGDWENDRSGAQVLMAVAPDAYNGGIFMVFDNAGFQHYSDSGNLTFKMKITINGKALPETEFKVDSLTTSL